jgi:lipid-A-disaccharide synthase-like uncharacterized protein
VALPGTYQRASGDREGNSFVRPRKVGLNAPAIMDFLTNLLWHNGNFLGIEWNAWKVIGWLGNATFFSRFFVQWYATEKKKQVVVPTAFWWLSLAGSFLLLCYALFYKRDSVFIFAYAFTWIPYIRNLIIHRRHEEAHLVCPVCGADSPPSANYCAKCGTKLAA